MTSTEVTQITVAGQRTGIIDLKQVLEEVAEEFSARPDDEIIDELMARLSKKNYIASNVKDAYRTAFLREYKKFMGEPFEETVDPDFLQIKVLGPGCPNCERLEQDLMALMAELRIKADLEHVRDPVRIADFGVMAMPALVINGKVKAAGRLPSRGTLKAWLLETTKRT
ncbi:MAG: thioredoxin family protein [Deltaproteobacteria bacterium]|nr:thioredoxin family protein [Deltaproteobacteria bacterium]